MKLDLQPNEVVTKVSDSLYHSQDGKLDGKLILTNQRIYFKTVEAISQTLFFEIKPAEIYEMYFFNVMRFFPAGIKLISKSGQEWKFSISKRDEWANAINKLF